MDLENLNDDDNVILTFPGQFSGDPRICLIPYSNAASPSIEIPSYPLNDVLKQTSYSYKNNIYLARLSNLMVNINYIGGTLNSMTTDVILN